MLLARHSTTQTNFLKFIDNLSCQQQQLNCNICKIPSEFFLSATWAGTVVISWC